MCLQYVVMALGADITKTHRKLAIPFYQRARAYMQADEMRVRPDARLTFKDKPAESHRETDSTSRRWRMHRHGA